MNGLLAALAILVPLAGGLTCWFARPRTATWVALGTGGIGIAAALALATVAFMNGSATAFGGLVVLDALGAWILAVVAVVAALTLIASPAYLGAEVSHGAIRPGDPPRYHAFLLWFIASLLAAPLADNIGLLWVAIEGTTIVSALLVGFNRTPQAIEAAWKYLILGSIGIGFALLGTLLAYASSVRVLGETSDALAWSRLMALAPGLDPALLRLAFVFALVGYGTKAGLAPFHTWLPDAHSQAPSPISALLSGAALAVAMYALVRFHLVASAGLGPSFSSGLLVVVGLMSLLLAVPFVVAQGDLKRLLAYSSIEHLGLLSLAFGFGGPLALGGATLHILGHALTKSTLFLAAGRLVQVRGSRHIGRLRGSASAAPGESRAVIVGTLLLGGIPPSAVFVAEISILFGGVTRGWGFASALAAILLALAFAGIVFHVARIALGPARGREARPSREGPLVRPPARPLVRPGTPRLGTTIYAAPLAVVALLGVWTPPPLADAIAHVVAVLGSAHG